MMTPHAAVFILPEGMASKFPCSAADTCLVSKVEAYHVAIEDTPLASTVDIFFVASTDISPISTPIVEAPGGYNVEVSQVRLS